MHRSYRVHSTVVSNAYAERFVLSIKSECLDRMVLLGERHLRAAVFDFVEHYYHAERNHQGFGNKLIELGKELPSVPIMVETLPPW